MLEFEVSVFGWMMSQRGKKSKKKKKKEHFIYKDHTVSNKWSKETLVPRPVSTGQYLGSQQCTNGYFNNATYFQSPEPSSSLSNQFKCDINNHERSSVEDLSASSGWKLKCFKTLSASAKLSSAGTLIWNELRCWNPTKVADYSCRLTSTSGPSPNTPNWSLLLNELNPDNRFRKRTHWTFKWKKKKRQHLGRRRGATIHRCTAVRPPQQGKQFSLTLKKSGFYKCLYLETRVVAAVLYEEVKGQLQNANRSKSGCPLQELKRPLTCKRSSPSVSVSTGGEKRWTQH